jgi:hypothetical protein
MEEALKSYWVFRLTSGIGARLIVLALLVIVLAGAAYLGLAAALGTAPALPPLLALLVVFVAVIVVHEALHGLGFLVFGGRPRFGFAVKGGMPYAFATCPGKHFTKRQFLVIGLLPLIVIGGAALAVVGSPLLAGYGALAFAINTSGAVGDLWMVTLILQSPSRTLFEDTDGVTLEAYLPAGVAPPRLPRGLDPKGWDRPVAWGMAWFTGAGLTYLVLTVVEISLARSMNGGAGGTLSIAGVALASARPGHARLFQPPVLIAATIVGLLAGGAVSRRLPEVSSGDHRQDRPL